MRSKNLFHIALLVLAPTLGSVDDGRLSPGTPAEVDMSGPVLRASVELFEEALAKDELKGAVLLVARRGKVVVHEAIGWRNEEQNLRMAKDTLFRLASNTKPVVATAILLLMEEKKLSLEDNVRRHIGSWDNYRAGDIKVRHLLSHTSGLRISSIFIRPLIQRSEEHPNAPSLLVEVDRFGRIGAEVPPGTSYSYSNPGYNTLGALVQIVSREPLENFFREHIYAPLGMKDSWNYEADAPSDRMARVYGREHSGWTIKWSPGDGPDWPFVRASGGMISTAWDYAVFCQMYLNRGSYGGKKLLEPDTVTQATSIQTVSDFTGDQIDGNYGFGWSVDEDGVFSHGGSDGTLAWVDPNQELVGIVFTQSQSDSVRRLAKQFQRVVGAACYQKETE